MLKVTFLTCAIIAAQPLLEGAQAGDAVPASMSMVWTGRFVNMTKVPVLGSITPMPRTKLPRQADGDSDIVGSIPPNPLGNTARDIPLLRGTQALSLCALPGQATDAEDGLACGGAQHNRWSAKVGSFNYDLSSVKPAFANALSPYATSWEAQPPATQ